MNKELSDKINFISFIITMFARSYKMSKQGAYRYLKQYGGMDFLNEHWWALHTDNDIYAVRDLYSICNMAGGAR